MSDASSTPAYYAFSRPEVVAMVKPKGKRVLDIGCAAGAMGAAMLEAGALEVVGVEIVGDAAKRAREKLTAVFSYDLERAPELPYPDGHFDVITFADVLEHVRDPVVVLKHLRRYLKNDGRIICSIPNVRHESVILPLLFNGTWKYEDAGILDRTHLRFFTLREINDFMRETGFEMLTPMHAVRSAPGPFIAPIADMVTAVGGDGKAFAEEATVIQYVFEARPASRIAATSAETVTNLWHGSREKRLLFVPPAGDESQWLSALARIAKDHGATSTIGVMLPSNALQAPPPCLIELAQRGIDMLVIEEPATTAGWERVVAGAGHLAVMPHQLELKKMGQTIGVDVSVAIAD
jgi:ubiquinone/menaquinone biosynthesis C-methylase UbiE